MKALSLTQPWATLVDLQKKRIETRSWWTCYRGPLVIHASRAYPADAKDLAQCRKFRSALGELDPLKLPRGVGLCVVTLAACVKTEHIYKVNEMGYELSVDEIAFGNFNSGRWAWLLEYDHHFEKPVEAKGALGLWEWPQKELQFPAPARRLPKQLVLNAEDR